MKMTFVMCESAVEEKVIATLHDLGAPGYTRFTGATGFGSHGRREGSAVWPGLNTMFVGVMPDAVVDALCDRMSALADERNGRLALRIFTVPAEQAF